VDRFRFVDGTGAERLNLENYPDGWYLGRGIDLGSRSVTRTFIQQGGVDGATLATSDVDIRVMTIPLLMSKQSSDENMLTLYEDLVFELNRETNILEIRPTGFATSFLIDTYRSEIPHIVGGQDRPDIFKFLEVGSPLILTIERAPHSRGAGTYL
jgi:hypothetical protein